MGGILPKTGKETFFGKYGSAIISGPPKAPGKSDEQKQLEFDQKEQNRTARQNAQKESTRASKGGGGRSSLSYKPKGMLGNTTKLGAGG